MKVSFITTVFNEEETIDRLLQSILDQTRKPDEVIVVDGGSKDETSSKCKVQSAKFEKAGIRFILLDKRGNRSVGRNAAVEASQGDFILCSDAGCILDKQWVEMMIEGFGDIRRVGNNSKNIDVVAGYYKGEARTYFQKSLIPYVLVMEDRVRPDEFLPASRSMAFRRNIWEKAGGFPEKYSHNEDYVFANTLKTVGARIFFQKKAVVRWIPRKTLKESFSMFFRFAYGDAEAGIHRPKVSLVFARYVVGVLALILYLWLKQFVILWALMVLMIFYSIWAIWKNYRYVRHVVAFFYLPMLQYTADIAVLSGTFLGMIKNRRTGSPPWFG